MPNSSRKIREYLGIEEVTWNKIVLLPNTRINNAEPLFTRIANPKMGT